ncbi:penicillin-binding protein 1A [Massilia polaris]|uniref:penicillin-binding protein 1A n=1 Tax=Massilia polaris TaxID=2728846 RepID=UPI001E511BEF|nr:PBP1A family penicillin-binding protein [Massilia polaris]
MRISSRLAQKRSTGTNRGFILIILIILLLLLAGAAAAGWFLWSIAKNVPEIDAVTDYKPKIPLRIYTADQVLIGEFGVERRDFVPIAQMPDLMKKAVLAIEDTRFYEHGGIDWIRAMGAAKANLQGGFREGASTITMQVARTFFLSREKIVSRKLTEIALALKIEKALSKDQILELYMNQIYLGQRAYGFSSAARAYFGKRLDQLSVGEIAMLAGLPQNPSRHNPAVNLKRATQRQHAVLKRMYELDYVTESQYRQALDQPVRVKPGGQQFATHAEYVAELARQAVYEQFQDEAYTSGIRVTTTILSHDQDAAYESVRRNVLAYDQRHGYRGPEGFIDLPSDPAERDIAIDEALQKRPSSDGLIPAVVTAVSPREVSVETQGGDSLGISGAGLRFVAQALPEKAKASIRLRPGALVRVMQDSRKAWSIVQVPQVAAAFVALDQNTGAYRALVGGFDFNLHKFNHVTQAWRQPGSAIKPFVYSAALEKGYSPGTMILDEALDLPGENAGATWSPQNDDGKFDGAVSMRDSLAHSKNVTTVRLLRAVSVPYAHEYLGRFGFDRTRHPKNLTLALGTGAVTPLQMAGGYAVFANGGYSVQPYLIAKIQDASGAVIKEFTRPAAPPENQRVIDQRNAFVVDTMLRAVTSYGTGAAAGARLGRTDISGKTGTTSDAIDGWFAGYGGDVVAVAWMGYDEPKSLGGREFGATLSLPIWIDYMKAAIARRPVHAREAPEGVMQEAGDWIYSEYAGLDDFRSIDITPLPESPPAEPEEEQDPPPPSEPGPDN